MQWRYFTHKPTEIRATKWTRADPLIPGMIRFEDRNRDIVTLPRMDMPTGAECVALIEGQAGYYMVKSGDYVCRGEHGELYPVPAEILEINYAPKPNQPREHISDDKIASGVEQHVQGVVDAKGNPNA